jgi:hypothetical protein
MPGDVGIRLTGEETSAFGRVFEVRDKNVPAYGAQAFITKVAEAGVGRAVLVGVAGDQEPLDASALIKRAREAGIDLEVFTDWGALVGAIVFASESRETCTVERAVAAIRSRLIQLELSGEAINDWDALTIRGTGQSLDI